MRCQNTNTTQTQQSLKRFLSGSGIDDRNTHFWLFIVKENWLLGVAGCKL